MNPDTQTPTPAQLAERHGSEGIRIICSECGMDIKGKVFLIEEFTLASPLFCSVSCIRKYNPANMTVAKLASLAGRIPARPPSASPSATEAGR